MALIKGSNFTDVNKALVTSYNETFKRTKSNVGDLVTTQSTNGFKQFVHAFILTVPDFRDWEGEKIINSLKLNEIVGKTEKKELTIGIDVEDLMSPNINQLIGTLSSLGYKAATLTDRMVAEFLINGTSSDSKYANYDGKPLFASNHAGGSNNNSSQALNAANLIESYEQMLSMKDEDGNPLSIKPTHLIVPNSLALTAKALVGNPYDQYGATNTMYNMLTVVVLPELDADPTTWYLASVHNGTTPFMLYQLEGPTETLLNDPSDPNFFFNDQVIYGSVARQAVRAAPYQMLQRNTAGA